MSLKVIGRMFLVLSCTVSSFYAATEGTSDLMREQLMLMQMQMFQQSQKAGTNPSMSQDQLGNLKNENTVLMDLLSYVISSSCTDIPALQQKLIELAQPAYCVPTTVRASMASEGVGAQEVTVEQIKALERRQRARNIEKDLAKERHAAEQVIAQNAVTYSYHISEYVREDKTPSIDGLKTWIHQKIKNNVQLMGKQSEVKEASLLTHAAMNGLAGPNGRFIFNNMRSDTSMLGTIGAGLTFRTMTVVGDEFEKILRQEGGPLVDAVVGKPIRGIGAGLKRVWNWLFHGGARSYTLEQVAHWKTEVLEVILKGLADHANKAQYDQGNGFGAQARVQRFDDFYDAGAHNEQAPEVPGDVTWMKFVDGLARDLDRLTLRIEIPKKFYSPSDDEDEALMASDGRLDLLDTATRIQEVLQFIKEHILVPTRTLKDLAAGDLKFLVPRLTSEISARFSLFESMVRQYHGIHVKPVPAETSTSRKDGASRSGYAGGGYSSYDQQGGY